LIDILSRTMADRRRTFAIVFLLVLGARWGVIAHFGNPVPYADEWGQILRDLLVPWSQGRMPWPEIYAATPLGHRLVFTRLWEIGWCVLAGGVDRPLVMQANAVLLSAGAALLAVWISRADLRPARRWSLIGAVAAVWMAPIAYANILWAYQSQFYFLILLTLVAADGLLVDTGGRRARWAAWGLALACAGTMGSGFLTPALLLATLAGIAWLQGGWSRKILGGGLIAVALGVGGWLLLPASTIQFGPSTGQRLLSFAQAGAGREVNLIGPVFQWPESARYLPAFVGHFPNAADPAIARLARSWKQIPLFGAVLWGGLSIVNWWPWLRQGCFAIQNRRSLRPGPPIFWLFLGGWTLAQLLGVSWARLYIPYVPTRYLDLTTLGFTANLALGWTGGVLHRFERWAWTGLTGACLVAMVAGIFAVELPRRAEENRASLRNVQVFLATGDSKRLQHQPLNHLPILGANPAGLIKVLGDPGVRALLRPAAAPAFDAPATGLRGLPFRFWWAPWAAAPLLAGARRRRAA
jgi:hypothetical protein